METQVIFIVMLIIFFAGMLWFSWLTGKWVKGSGDFLVAGRQVSLLVNILGISSIGWAGTSIALSPGLAVRGGLSDTLGFAFTYSILGIFLYAFLFSPMIRRTGAYTLPEWLEMRFSTSVRYVVSIALVIGLTTAMANNLLSLATTVTGYTGWPQEWSNLLGLGILLGFTIFGGLWSVTVTDFAQMLIGLVGVPILGVALVMTFGGFDFISTNWPTGNWFSNGISGYQLPFWSLAFPSAITFVLTYSILLVWGSQHYWLRIASVRSERVAKLSFAWAGIILFVINLFLGLIGLYAAAANPGMFQPVGTALPEAAYGVLLRSFASPVAAYLIVFAIAASMSTATAVLIAAVSTVVRDLYQRGFRPHADPKSLVMPSRIVTVVLAIAAWAMMSWPGGPLYLFAFSNSWSGPAAVALLLGFWWRRTTATATLVGVICGIVAMLIWTGLGLFKIATVDPVAHVSVIGLAATAIPMVILTFLTKPKYYGLPSWRPLGPREAAESAQVEAKESV